MESRWNPGGFQWIPVDSTVFHLESVGECKVLDSIFENMISNSLIIVDMDNTFISKKELLPLIMNTKSVL